MKLRKENLIQNQDAIYLVDDLRLTLFTITHEVKQIHSKLLRTVIKLHLNLKVKFSELFVRGFEL